MAYAVPFPGANRLYGAPAGRDDVEPSVEVFANGKCIVTCWQLTPSELETITRTGKVFVSTLSGDVMFPIFVGDDKAVRDVVSAYGKTIPQQTQKGDD